MPRLILPGTTAFSTPILHSLEPKAHTHSIQPSAEQAQGILCLAPLSGLAQDCGGGGAHWWLLPQTTTYYMTSELDELSRP